MKDKYKMKTAMLAFLIMSLKTLFNETEKSKIKFGDEKNQKRSRKNEHDWGEGKIGDNWDINENCIGDTCTSKVDYDDHDHDHDDDDDDDDNDEEGEDNDEEDGSRMQEVNKNVDNNH